MIATQEILTVPQLAKRLNKSCASVHQWIRAGKIRACNESNGDQRPRWTILWADYLEFRDRHSNQCGASERRQRPPRPIKQHV